MKSNKTKWIGIGLVILSMVAVICIAFSNSDLKDAWGALRSMDFKWVLAGVLLYALYLSAEGFGLWCFLRRNRFCVSVGTAIHFSFAGLFYANLTPGSSGGQPMQIYLMRTRGVPVGTATSALTVRFFFNQLASCIWPVVLYLMNREFCARQLGGVKGFIIVGLLINFISVPIIVLGLINRPLLMKLGNALIGLLARLHICRDRARWEAGFEKVMRNFMDATHIMLHQPINLLFQLLISMLEMLALFAVPITVYYALGLSGTTPLQILAVSAMLFVSASYTPLPGASGAQEGGFLVFFNGIFTGGTISIALLVWRFITYYMSLLIGAADSLYTNLRKRRAPLKVAPAEQGKENDG